MGEKADELFLHLARVIVPAHPSHTKTGKPTWVKEYFYDNKKTKVLPFDGHLSDMVEGELYRIQQPVISDVNRPGGTEPTIGMGSVEYYKDPRLPSGAPLQRRHKIEYRILDSVATKYKGIPIVVEIGKDDPLGGVAYRRLQEIIKTLQDADIPPAHLHNLQGIFLATKRSPADEVMSGGIPGYRAYATHSNHRIAVWSVRDRLDPDIREVLIHEIGHEVEASQGIMSPRNWEEVQAKDKETAKKFIENVNMGHPRFITTIHKILGGSGYGVTEYGSTNEAEDFAESYMLWKRDQEKPAAGVGFYKDLTGRSRTIRFADLWPERDAMLRRIFHRLGQYTGEHSG